jgi:hypothetical protein
MVASCAAGQPFGAPTGQSTASQNQLASTEAVSNVATTAISTPFQRETGFEFSLVDRPDDVDGYQVHFIYALPSDGRDDLLDVNGVISLSASAMNTWLVGKIGHGLRYDTYEGNLDISFLPLDQDAETIGDLGTNILVFLEHEVKSRGFDPSHKIFVVYYDGLFVTAEGYCGLAAYPPDGAGQTAVLLLRGYNPTTDTVCPRQFTKSADYTGFFEMTILHEVLHLLGMVPSCAPNDLDGHVSDNPQDLMYSEYDGSYSPLYMVLDYHNDDYYGHGNPTCPDLARSSFLEPLPSGAEPPPGWSVSSSYLPPNPLENQ